MRVKCLTHEHNTISPTRAQTPTARSGVDHTNHLATPSFNLLDDFAFIVLRWWITLMFELNNRFMKTASILWTKSAIGTLISQLLKVLNHSKAKKKEELDSRRKLWYPFNCLYREVSSKKTTLEEAVCSTLLL